MNVAPHSRPRSPQRTGPKPEHQLYRSFSPEEEKERLNVHYEVPPKFFYLITGGEWNVYSSNIWSEGATTDTESQEAKLDVMARIMELKPGDRLLDVGCGWAGPLVYLSKTYGVHGVGVTPIPAQKRGADERIARHGVDVKVVESHWRDYEDDQGFDAVFTDEAIVHFHDLGGFFAKARSLLHAGGIMLNKELHFTSRRYSTIATRASAFVHEIFGLTGNYRTIAEELALLDENSFELKQIYQMPMVNYLRTVAAWIGNMRTHRVELERLVGPEHYQRFRTYFHLLYRIFSGHTMTLDAIAARKITD